MKDFILKLDFFLILGIIGSLIPIWSQLEKILQSEREAATKRTEIQVSIEFIQQRLDRIDNWISSNSNIRRN